MRFALFSSASASLARKGVLLLGCAVALSACNTTNDGKPVKTALISSSDTAPQTSAAGAAVGANAPQAVAVAGTPAAATAAAGAAAAAPVADAAVGTTATAMAAGPAATGGAAAIAAATTTNGTLVPGVPAVGAEAVASGEPVLPAVVPIPGERGVSQPMMAYAGARAAASPASVAANMAFETPEHAPKDIDALIAKYSVAYDVPERLVRRVVHRESRFNPGARNGPYWGLMQISHPTARGMGYKGAPKGLLDAETNLKYAVRYLSGAYKVAGGNESQAVRYYARGYYYDAKRKGLLEETGMDGGFRTGPTRDAAAAIEPVSLPSGSSAPLPGVAPIQASYTPAQ
ncbi:lytic transglycosylase domain-containing protein [Ochrobactrum sp. Q0168]|uniref:transglycosylase SLT domain-containing protein n=1 Tax=Ochrobactrum sp. Q0168 TaxID=2793241 RepID=UPI0018EBA06C|nr:lytic transglycosylase domain-containing protein [Ochrobactrum sp. Q0168]